MYEVNLDGRKTQEKLKNNNTFFSIGDSQDSTKVPEMPIRPLSDGRNGPGCRPDRRTEESPFPEVSPEEEETQPHVHVAHHRRRGRAQRHLQSRESGNWMIENKL
jgi:hypothetical protein